MFEENPPGESSVEDWPQETKDKWKEAFDQLPKEHSLPDAYYGNISVDVRDTADPEYAHPDNEPHQEEIERIKAIVFKVVNGYETANKEGDLRSP